MPEIRIARSGRLLGQFTLEQVRDWALSGEFLPSDDALLESGTIWTKLNLLQGVEFPKALAPTPPLDVFPPPRPPEYTGIYRSSDERLVTGFCAGVAHSLGVHRGTVRFSFLILVLLTGSLAFWIYLFSLLLPQLPTKNVP